MPKPQMTASQKVAVDNIRVEMARLNIDRVTLAADLNVKRDWLARRLTGYAEITLDDLAAIARELDTTSARLLEVPNS